ncbi:MAG: hypothetical protein AAFR30_10805, partial [Cyanobacteria bacterium J06628_4]
NQPFIQKSLGAFHFQCDKLKAALQNSSIGCAEIGNELLQLYFSTLVEQNLVHSAPAANPTPSLSLAGKTTSRRQVGYPN